MGSFLTFTNSIDQSGFKIQCDDAGHKEGAMEHLGCSPMAASKYFRSEDVQKVSSKSTEFSLIKIFNFNASSLDSLFY